LRQHQAQLNLRRLLKQLLLKLLYDSAVVFELRLKLFLSGLFLFKPISLSAINE
jgi:hypothetical protein